MLSLECWEHIVKYTFSLINVHQRFVLGYMQVICTPVNLIVTLEVTDDKSCVPKQRFVYLNNETNVTVEYWFH